ncbi:MAG: molecular chaperone DnaJ [Desulfobacterales bacterium]|nr:MAG: molecular chaperone DnaJ [Desulfobacterales bacterium]
MYLAKIKKDKEYTYMLRESIPKGNGFSYRNICGLGPHPGAWIDYPGGNAWYLSPDLEARVEENARHFDANALEALFRPFLKPSIKRATDAFYHRTSSGFKRMTKQEKQALARSVHAFDKRRAHYLKFGNMDQGPVVNIPPVLFKNLKDKSRDEIEQYFMAEEKCIRSRDLKSYVYTVFDLQRFFDSFMATQMPQAMDQNKVEKFFIQELCALNKELFSLTDHLHDYFIRYAVMFFDHTYGDTVLLQDMANDFMYRSRFSTPPPKPSVTTSKARTIFGFSKDDLKTMDKKTLIRKFRTLAKAHHPDKGGDNHKFAEINEAYQALLKKIRPR